MIYPSNELADAMLRAMKVTREEYEQLRGGGADLKNAVEAESLCNLRRQLSAHG